VTTTGDTTSGSACPLPPGNRHKKWILQKDGSYLPVFSERPGPQLVSSMTHRSSNKLEQRVAQTWGIIATVIKQQEQLFESQLKAIDNSKVAMDKTPDTISTITQRRNNGTAATITRDTMDKTSDTICAVILTHDTIQFNEYNLDGDDNSETLDTEHDVFADFYPRETILASISLI
jgi:hypothetical protein